MKASTDRAGRLTIYRSWAAVLVLACACGLLVMTAPLGGDFLLSESPRNALNGAFVLDLLREKPLLDPLGWAGDYYLRYPALTILFYPPLFYGVLAIFYALFGVSQMSAMACMGSFAFVLACGVYTLGRRIASPNAALAGALLLLAAPETIQTGQQVLLEIPMMALATWGAVFLAQYGDRLSQVRAGPGSLVLAAAFLVIAVYTKQTALFIGTGLALGLLAWRRALVLRRLHFWIIAACIVVALVPLMLIQYRFGSFNVSSIVNRPDMGSPDRLSLAGLTWYAVRLPAMLGWPALLLAALLPLLASLRRQWRLPRGDAWLLGGWLLVTYAILAMIDLKERRHGMPLLVPLAVFAAASVDRLLPAPPWRLAASGLAAALFGAMSWWVPVVGAGGYREAAEIIGQLAPPNARVLFSGNRDGAFIFNVRTLPGRGDLAVVRVDKLLLDIAIIPQLGLNPRQLSREDITALLNRIGIAYVVAVPGQWTEAPVMRAFEEVLASPQFTEVARIPVTGPVEERALVIYRNAGPLTLPPEPYGAHLRAAGVTLRR